MNLALAKVVETVRTIYNFDEAVDNVCRTDYSTGFKVEQLRRFTESTIWHTVL